jgi:hypothetical protein
LNPFEFEFESNPMSPPVTVPPWAHMSVTRPQLFCVGHAMQQATRPQAPRVGRCRPATAYRSGQGPLPISLVCGASCCLPPPPLPPHRGSFKKVVARSFSHPPLFLFRVSRGTSPSRPLASRPLPMTESCRPARNLKKHHGRLCLPGERCPRLFFCPFSVHLTSPCRLSLLQDPPRSSPAIGAPSPQPNATARHYHHSLIDNRPPR